MPPEQFYSTELMKDLTNVKNQERTIATDYKIICITGSQRTIVLDYSNQLSADAAVSILQKNTSDEYVKIIKLY